MPPRRLLRSRSRRRCLQRGCIQRPIRIFACLEGAGTRGVADAAGSWLRRRAANISLKLSAGSGGRLLANAGRYRARSRVSPFSGAARPRMLPLLGISAWQNTTAAQGGGGGVNCGLVTRTSLDFVWRATPSRACALGGTAVVRSLHVHVCLAFSGV